jgi:ABC-2 type transport system permease protein
MQPAVLTETMIIFRRAMRLSLRNPVWVIIGLFQPLLYLALFGPLLERVAKVSGFPGASNSWRVFVPGLLVQLGIFGAAFVGFGLIEEMRSGVIERMRVTPASRVALLAGRVLRDVVVLVVQGTVLLVAALAFGLRAPVGDLLLGLALVAVLGAAFASASYAAGLLLKTEDSMASVLNTIAVPLLLLSGILLPMSLAPGWLRTVSDVNPVKHVVDAVRSLFLGHIGGSTVAWGLLATVALVVAGMAFGTRTFRRVSS